jgi:poly-beta-1,6-N-acetyl-D-glucosamine synthase
MTATPQYVLVSAARNEAAFIEHTLSSVVRQSWRPVTWVVVSDGSTDETDDIVRGFASHHLFIQLLRVDADRARNFGSKARAVNAGYELVRGWPHEYVGILDADVALPSDYYERVLEKFAAGPTLGLAGGLLADRVGDEFVAKATSLNWSVNGPIQMFRRQAWESIGGYQYMPYGGVDTVAEVRCRMHGWCVRSFPDLRARHLRQTGRATDSALRAAYRAGVENYKNGFHPLFMIGRCVKHTPAAPIIAGALAMALGYLVVAARGEGWQVDEDFVRFLRKEQVRRLVTRDWA